METPKKKSHQMNKFLIVNTTDRIYFQLCQSIFSMNGIPFQVHSTMDSMYNAFGKFEIYVSEDDKQQALDLLENNVNTPDA